jgi:integrase
MEPVAGKKIPPIRLSPRRRDAAEATTTKPQLHLDDIASAVPSQGVDPRLEPTISALSQLSPAKQELAMNLVRQLAEREGINVAISPAMGLQVPAQGIDIWVAKLQSERYSPRTIKRYRWAVERYLEQDPFPTSMRIREYLAQRLKEVSSALTSFERKALKSLFDFLHKEGLWNTNPVNGIKPIPVGFRERRLPSEESVQKLLQAKHYRKQDTAKFRQFGRV